MTSLFGAVVLLIGAILTATLSITWLFAAGTGAFAQEREAIAQMLQVKEAQEEKEDKEETASDNDA